MKIRGWAKKRKSSYAQVAREVVSALISDEGPWPWEQLKNGTVGSPFEADLAVALENGLIYVTPQGEHIFYPKNYANELPYSEEFISDMASINAQSARS